MTVLKVLSSPAGRVGEPLKGCFNPIAWPISCNATQNPSVPGRKEASAYMPRWKATLAPVGRAV
jgi:hypothetical protein